MACRGGAAHTDIDLANSRKRSSAHLKVDVDLRAAPQGLPLAVLADGKAAIGLGLPDVPADGAVGGARQGGWNGRGGGAQALGGLLLQRSLLMQAGHGVVAIGLGGGP